MGLPKIELPIREMILPSTGKPIKYRPFTVKEEKILLVAQESDDGMQEIIAARQVVNNCLLDVDVDQIAMFDLEFIILMIRSVSVDNQIDFRKQSFEFVGISFHRGIVNQYNFIVNTQ